MHNQLTSLINRRHFLTLGTVAAAGGALAPWDLRAAEAFKLPDLPFAASALEPHIDTKTMEIHHGKHHAAYIAKLNDALTANPALARQKLEDLLASLPSVEDAALRSTLRNNGGGHWNHAFFWESLVPATSSGAPSGDLQQALIAAFESMEKFQSAFAAAAMGRFGSGWAWLIKKDGKLAIVSSPNQDNPLMKGTVPDTDLGTPILGLDVWEHAYYLHYQNRRADYVAAWWKVVNWAKASERFASV